MGAGSSVVSGTSGHNTTTGTSGSDSGGRESARDATGVASPADSKCCDRSWRGLPRKQGSRQSRWITHGLMVALRGYHQGENGSGACKYQSGLHVPWAWLGRSSDPQQRQQLEEEHQEEQEVSPAALATRRVSSQLVEPSRYAYDGLGPELEARATGAAIEEFAVRLMKQTYAMRLSPREWKVRKPFVLKSVHCVPVQYLQDQAFLRTEPLLLFAAARYGLDKDVLHAALLANPVLSSEGSMATTLRAESHDKEFACSRWAGTMPIHHLVQNQFVDPSMLKFAVECEPSALAVPALDGRLPLHIYLTTSHSVSSANVETLIRAYQDALLHQRGTEGRTALHHALENPTIKTTVLQLLVQAEPELLVAADDRGFRPIHAVACLHAAQGDRTFRQQQLKLFSWLRHKLPDALAQTCDEERKAAAEAEAENESSEASTATTATTNTSTTTTNSSTAGNRTLFQHMGRHRRVVGESTEYEPRAHRTEEKAQDDGHGDTKYSDDGDDDEINNNTSGSPNGDGEAAGDGQLFDRVNIYERGKTMALHIAARNPATSGAVFLYLAQRYPDAVSCHDAAGDLPLHAACQHLFFAWIDARHRTHRPIGERVEKIKTIIGRLLKYYPPAIRTRNAAGRLPLHVLCAMQTPVPMRLFRYVLDLCPDAAGSCAADNDRETALHFACCSRQPTALVSELLTSHPECARSRDRFGMLPLHWTFSRPRGEDYIDSKYMVSNFECVLRAFPSAVDIPDNTGDTVMYALVELREFYANGLGMTKFSRRMEKRACIAAFDSMIVLAGREDPSSLLRENPRTRWTPRERLQNTTLLEEIYYEPNELMHCVS